MPPVWWTCRTALGRPRACLRLALLLVEDARGRYVLLVQGPGEHQQTITVEVAGLPVTTAQAVLAELDELRASLNVYRGHLLDVTLTPMGTIHLEFIDRPGLHRDEVVLPEEVLRRIERHALSVADLHRARLQAAGQHLKRGLLLYGPPGTGKTHTTRYLLGRMTDYTRLVLTGRALVAVGSAAALARDLHPAVVVLEDVDLVAEERRSARPRARCCLTCSTPWTAAHRMPICCSCSPPTGPTYSSRRWRPAPAKSMSPWESPFRTPPPGTGCWTSTACARPAGAHR